MTDSDSLTEAEQALAEMHAVAARAITAARRIAQAAPGPWAGSILASAERLAAHVRWHERDLERRRADQIALKKEQEIG